MLLLSGSLALLGGRLIVLSLLSTFPPCPAFSLKVRLLALTLFSKAGPVFHHIPTDGGRLQLQFTDYVSQFCSWGVGAVFNQAPLKPACREKWLATFLKADTYWDWVQQSEM
jgi:hypothetical protein